MEKRPFREFNFPRHGDVSNFQGNEEDTEQRGSGSSRMEIHAEDLSRISATTASTQSPRSRIRGRSSDLENSVRMIESPRRRRAVLYPLGSSPDQHPRQSETSNLSPRVHVLSPRSRGRGSSAVFAGPLDYKVRESSDISPRLSNIHARQSETSMSSRMTSRRHSMPLMPHHHMTSTPSSISSSGLSRQQPARFLNRRSVASTGSTVSLPQGARYWEEPERVSTLSNPDIISTAVSQQGQRLSPHQMYNYPQDLSSLDTSPVRFSTLVLHNRQSMPLPQSSLPPSAYNDLNRVNTLRNPNDRSRTSISSVNNMVVPGRPREFSRQQHPRESKNYYIQSVPNLGPFSAERSLQDERSLHGFRHGIAPEALQDLNRQRSSAPNFSLLNRGMRSELIPSPHDPAARRNSFAGVGRVSKRHPHHGMYTERRISMSQSPGDDRKSPTFPVVSLPSVPAPSDLGSQWGPAPRNKRLANGMACEACRSRKVRCDGKRPCKTCCSRGEPCRNPRDKAVRGKGSKKESIGST